MAYNHEKYVIEHLESIKFQVLTYGRNVHVDVIVSDDCSRDGTRDLIDIWFALNRSLFRNVDFLYNSKNLGTCANISNAIDRVVAKRCKITGSDDVYSSENIFELSFHDDEFSMLSGRVLYLRGPVIEFDLFTNIFETATDVIYKNANALYRFKHLSFTNAPNLVYSMSCLKHRNVRDYLSRFDVVEDWPLQISIAREFPQKRIKLIDRVLVYYRRTEGSTYIVANERFLDDKDRIYNDLLVTSRSLLEKIRLTSRKKALRRQGGIIKKLWNLDTYFFALAAVVRLPSIIKRSLGINIQLNRHRAHYSQIHEQARSFVSTKLDQME